ncbi:MAG: type II toxin-antitoxin system Phd/YefM family antitoxin [Candidatus Binatia bacterium]
MPTLPEIVPITDLRQDAAAVIDRVRRSSKPLVITQRGRPAAVVLSPEAYERGEQEKKILHLLVQGDREIAKGKGHELAKVLQEAERLLASET